MHLKPSVQSNTLKSAKTLKQFELFSFVKVEEFWSTREFQVAQNRQFICNGIIMQNTGTLGTFNLNMDLLSLIFPGKFNCQL